MVLKENVEDSMDSNEELTRKCCRCRAQKESANSYHEKTTWIHWTCTEKGSPRKYLSSRNDLRGREPKEDKGSLKWIESKKQQILEEYG